MNPKMTAKDAGDILGISSKQLYKKLLEDELPYYKSKGSVYFGYSTAKKVFNFKVDPKAIAFQIVKGGTGKTSLAFSFAVRANLYGLKVLCIDLDQQGNLSNCFNVDAENLPVMIDILAEGYSFKDAITRVYPGMDILTSRIENALIDDVIKLKNLDLAKVYYEPFNELKREYDLIVVDCPPNVGQSVAAVTLGVDMVVAPVVPENFALSGLRVTNNTISELRENYHKNIDFAITINKYDPRGVLTKDAVCLLKDHPSYKVNLLNAVVRNSQEFPNCVAKGISIFDTIKSTTAKNDIDALTRELLGIGRRDAKEKSLVARLFGYEETLL